jgi:hypothetical protein
MEMKDERVQVNLRLDRGLVAQLDETARREGADRTELARRLLGEGLARERVERALGDYAGGRASASRAAELAGVSLYEMLDRIHDAAIPYELDPDVLDRIDRPPGREGSLGRTSREDSIASAPSSHRRVSERAPTWDTDSGIADVRERYRPKRVRVLFVGESSPAGGTHFYRANSNLFRATRDAFVQAHGAGAVPEGEAFLGYFAAAGCWLVDLAERPVNRMPGQERRAEIEAGVDRLAGIIRSTRPEHIVVVKASIESAVGEATRRAGLGSEAVTALPFPVRQWRRAYIRELAAFLEDSA